MSQDNPPLVLHHLREHYPFSQLKPPLLKATKRTQEGLRTKISAQLPTITPQRAANDVTTVGYEPS